MTAAVGLTQELGTLIWEQAPTHSVSQSKSFFTAVSLPSSPAPLPAPALEELKACLKCFAVMGHYKLQLHYLLMPHSANGILFL